MNYAVEPGLLKRQELGCRVMGLLERLALFSDEPDALTRLYLSPAHRSAAEFLLESFRAFGVDAKIDAIGNVVARYEGVTPSAPTLLVGSHIDTVRNAGKYDGNLGVIVGLAVLEELSRNSERLPFAIEVVAFGDEEGVRFPATLSGSLALADRFDVAALEGRDEAGVSLAEALVQFGGDPTKIEKLARSPKDILAFIEVHIEQGPLLEKEGIPVGVVTAISGATRLSVKVRGLAGHAGTVPMMLRSDALAGAAEMIVAIERLAREEQDLVVTVGQMKVLPGATNVIPGEVDFTVDARSPNDRKRIEGITRIELLLMEIARARSINVDIVIAHNAPACACDQAVIGQIERSIVRQGLRPLKLSSGAGHDAMAMAHLCPVGMLFVRCRGGISHNPAECISAEDAGAAVEVLLNLVRNFPSSPTSSGNK